MADELTAQFRSLSDRAGLFLDFDGTLSDIVELPHEARPVTGAPEILADLATKFALVTIVSGRRADQLLEWLGDAVEIWGVHGAQRVSQGRVMIGDLAAPFLEQMRAAYQDAAASVHDLDIPGTLLEDKEVVFNLHYRRAPDRDRARMRLKAVAERLARTHDLVVVEGRSSFELRPPTELSKQRVIAECARRDGLAAVAFVGDDRVDLPAFDALDELARQGLTTVRVAVASDEAPPDLIRRADVVVEGTAGVMAWLRALL